MRKEFISLKDIESGMKDEEWIVRADAMIACKGRDVPLELIERGLNNAHWRVRAAAMSTCQGRDVPLEWIERGLNDDDWCVRVEAMRACKGRDVPIELIERGLNNAHWRVRAAAMSTCQGRDVPLEWIERGMNDEEFDVQEVAVNVCKSNGIPVPVIRTFEPPALVYKKCVGGVIVIAEIPKDAQVRGSFGRKCRASKAIIKQIIRYEVGISKYDRTTTYRVGDVIEIDNFDYSDRECSTGFHFFCTREEAESY